MRSLCAFVTILLLFSPVALEGQTSISPKRNNFTAFWLKFKGAVAKNNKEAIASMTNFPLRMPYGMRNIRTRAELIKGYGKIFDTETKKCFAAAEPQFEQSGKTKGYTVSCGEAMIYWFEELGGSYKFTGVDNINE